jgi:hypothetical protein
MHVAHGGVAHGRVAHALVVSALVGCGGSLEPGDVAGTYGLITVDAAVLPYLVSATRACDERIVAGRLTLSGNGGFALRYDDEQECAGASAAVQRSREYTGGFSLDGRRIFLDGVSADGLRISYEGQARGTGFVIVTSRHLENPTRELELGFEPTLERRDE